MLNATSRAPITWAVAIATIAAVIVALWPRSQPAPFYFAVTMRTADPGVARLYYGVPVAPGTIESVTLPVQGGNVDVQYEFPMREGRYLNVRFDPTNRASSSVTLSHARVIDRSRNLMRTIGPERYKMLQQIDRLETNGPDVTVLATRGADDPALVLDLGPPLLLKSYGGPSYRTLLHRFGIAFGTSLTVALLLFPILAPRMAAPVSGLIRRARSWASVSSLRMIFLTAAAAVALSCYPILFFGKSFLSPNNHTHACLVYGEMPTVPSSREIDADNAKGSDLGAAMWYSWPGSVIASRALLKDFEIPLWNRYDSCGLPFLGQGQSMFGDPLHLLVVLANGSTGWWDLKYLLAKFIFCAALGLCVLQLTRHLPAALLITGSSAFIGFFSYRYSHPAFFTLCYAPLIFLAWLKLVDAPEGRPGLRWLGLMVVANWMMVCSGTVKEAYILLLAMNLGGLLTLLLNSGVANKAAKVRQALFIQFLFVLMSTPFWLTFIDTLRDSWTVYDAGAVFQLQPSVLIGLFDDIFYRHLSINAPHVLPTANFFILIAVLWLCASPSRSDHRHSARGVTAVCLLALAFIFGIVPTSLILKTPYVGRIYHIDNIFSCVAVVCLLVLAGFGIKAFWADYESPRFRRTYFAVLAAVAGLLILYSAARRIEAPADPQFFWGYSLILVLCAAASPWLGWRLLRTPQKRKRFLVCAAVMLVLLHWRHGMHVATPFDSHVINPHQRANLFAETSGAIRLLKSRPLEPFRSVGLKYNFFPGYGAVLGLEQIDGADPLLNKHYKVLIDASGIRLPFASTQGGELDKDLAEHVPLLDMLNVRYVLGYAGGKDEITPSLKKIASVDLDVYESAKVWPRAFFTDQLISYKAESAFVQLLKEGDGKPFAGIPEINPEQPYALGAVRRNASPSPTREIVPASDYALTTNTTSFKVKAPRPGIVVLTEPYVEDEFRLRVNGEPASYIRVNSAFRGVFVPAAGEYQFSYTYWPRHFTISLLVSGVGLVLFLLWMGTGFRGSQPKT